MEASNSLCVVVAKKILPLSSFVNFDEASTLVDLQEDEVDSQPPSCRFSL